MIDHPFLRLRNYPHAGGTRPAFLRCISWHRLREHDNAGADHKPLFLWRSWSHFAVYSCFALTGPSSLTISNISIKLMFNTYVLNKSSKGGVSHEEHGSRPAKDGHAPARPRGRR